MSDAADREIERLRVALKLAQSDAFAILQRLNAERDRSAGLTARVEELEKTQGVTRYHFDRYQDAHRRTQKAEGKLARLEAKQARLSASWQRLDRERSALERERSALERQVDEDYRHRHLVEQSRLRLVAEVARLQEAGAALAVQLAGVADVLPRPRPPAARRGRPPPLPVRPGPVGPRRRRWRRARCPRAARRPSVTGARPVPCPDARLEVSTWSLVLTTLTRAASALPLPPDVRAELRAATAELARQLPRGCLTGGAR